MLAHCIVINDSQGYIVYSTVHNMVISAACLMNNLSVVVYTDLVLKILFQTGS